MHEKLSGCENKMAGHLLLAACLTTALDYYAFMRLCYEDNKQQTYLGQDRIRGTKDSSFLKRP